MGRQHTHGHPQGAVGAILRVGDRATLPPTPFGASLSVGDYTAKWLLMGTVSFRKPRLSSRTPSFCSPASSAGLRNRKLGRPGFRVGQPFLHSQTWANKRRWSRLGAPID